MRLKEGDQHLLEKKLKVNRVRDLMEQQGGNGIFYIPDRDHFQLTNPEWKNDVWPEFMDGKNVFDFVDPDILQKLEKLEREEDEIRNKMDVEDDDDNSSSDLSEDLIEAHEEVMENKKTIRKKHGLVVGSTVPRRVRDLTATEKFMSQIRTDKAEGLNELKLLSKKKRRSEKDRLKRNLLNESQMNNASDEEDDEDINLQMDVDGDNSQHVKKFKKAKHTAEEIAEMKKKERIETHKGEIAERMKKKIQKKWSRGMRIDASDRKIASKLPKHLNTGKRGIGKTDRR